jgi:hypothetical protein
MGHAEDGGAIETEAIASIADPPKPVGKPGEGPSLAEIRETPRLLNDVVASGRRVVNQVGLEAAELVQEVIGLTVDRSGIGGLLWLLTRRRYDGSQRRRPARAASACIAAAEAGNHDDPAEEETRGESPWVFMVPHRASDPFALGASCSSASTTH